MQTGRIEVDVLVNKVISAAEDRRIDDPSNLRDSNVFIFCGTLDTIVRPGNQIL